MTSHNVKQGKRQRLECSTKATILSVAAVYRNRLGGHCQPTVLEGTWRHFHADLIGHLAFIPHYYVTAPISIYGFGLVDILRTEHVGRFPAG